jgi:predicted dehydrogenase
LTRGDAVTSDLSLPLAQQTPAPISGASQESGRLRVAIIGSGMIAAVHRRSALLAGAEVVGVLGSGPERSAQVAREWGIRTAFSSLAELSASDAQVVHICSPNATHTPYAEAVLAAGKHLICEKPLATSLADALRMQELAERAGVVATVPFVYRYHPVVREIRARVQADEFGSWNLLHGQYLQDWLLSSRASNWRVDPAQGGASRAFADIGSHWCDLVEWVSGQRLESVVAQLSVAVAERSAQSGQSFSGGTDGQPVPVRTEDTASMLFRTTEDVPGSLVVSQVAAGRKNRLWFELDGSIGSAAFDQESPESFWLGTSGGSQTVVRDPRSGSAEQRRLSYLPAGHTQGYGDCFAAFVADTYAAVRGEQPEGLPTFADGVRSARIVDAVVQSSRTSTWTAVSS